MLSIIYELSYKWRLVEMPWKEHTDDIMRAERAVQGPTISLEAEDRKKSKING